MSVRGDKPVTASLQTEARGAHLKQRDDWPTAIAGQHLHETGEVRGEVWGEGGMEGETHQKSGILSQELRHSADRSVTEPG